jgi:hypothetical protein
MPTVGRDRCLVGTRPIAGRASRHGKSARSHEFQKSSPFNALCRRWSINARFFIPIMPVFHHRSADRVSTPATVCLIVAGIIIDKFPHR